MAVPVTAPAPGIECLRHSKRVRVAVDVGVQSRGDGARGGQRPQPVKVGASGPVAVRIAQALGAHRQCQAGPGVVEVGAHKPPPQK